KENEENILSTADVLSTDKEKVSTAKDNVESTDEQRKGTKDHTEEGSATQTTQKPTSTIFGDDETIAKVLLNMSQAKAVSREKEKGVELKDIEETDRPKPTSTRSLLTLKPLPKIDPKDKDKENDELRLHLTIAPDEEKEADYEILDRKYPFKEWKTECLGTKPQANKAEHLEEINQNVVIRSNGQKRYFSTLMRVLSIFDREDLNES
ncbi:hypothetical protein Tco_0159370, partial [Tanacetum coccineum]